MVLPPRFSIARLAALIVTAILGIVAVIGGRPGHAPGPPAPVASEPAAGSRPGALVDGGASSR